MNLAKGCSSWCVLIAWNCEEPWRPPWDSPLAIFCPLYLTSSSLQNFELCNGSMWQWDDIIIIRVMCSRVLE